MKVKKMAKILSAFLLVFVGVFTLVSCGGESKPSDEPKEEAKVYTYNTYTAVSPSNWNALTYQDNNDTQIMNYIGSSFFEFDYKFDNNGKIIPGEFEVEYSAATKLEDVSASYVGNEWGIPEGAKYRAYKITLREDLKWEDGTPISAEDFVYTMKEQLNPLFRNYRADSFYVGATIIHNAENYAKQGQLTYVDNYATESFVYTVADLVKGSDGVYKQANGMDAVFALKDPLVWAGGKTLDYYKGYLESTAYAALVAKADDKGRVAITDETIALLTTAITTEDWGENAENVPCYIYYEKEYEAMDFDKVGIFVGSTPYEIVLVLDKELVLLKEDGSLDYRAAYNMADLPLVKKSKYEKCKQEPTISNELWTTTYNHDVASTSSWGPYKLTYFQTSKQYILEKNPNWFGYGVEKYAGQYQTDRIVCDTIPAWNTAWLSFLSGKLDGISIDVSIAQDYKSSDQAYYTPDDFVASLQLQSDKAALASRQTEGVNKTILTYTDFRKALSLSINRSDFAAKTTTSSLAGYGLFNSMHYYDVANGGVYRNEDVAKKVLCDVYAINVDDYASLDEAVAAVTGYDLAVARQLVTKAYNEALAAGDIKETDVVQITLGTGAINEVVTRRFDYIKNAWVELVKTTPLEGKLQFGDLVDKGDAWSTSFRKGEYDVCMGGWSGAAWDPGYFLLAYLSPSYMYSTKWDTSSITMEFTMPGVGENGADVTDTLTLMQWYNCLNGAAGSKYNWGQGAIPESKRLYLIAALEKQVLEAYYSVPLYNNYGASLISYQLDYVTYEYNTFMGYGGLRYAKYNYSDAEWAQLCADNNNQIDYR